MMAFKTPARCNNPIKPVSDNSLSTHSLQPKAIPNPNSKWIGIGSEMPWRMTRLRTEEPTGPKKHRGFADKGQATHGPTATATHNYQESLENEDGRHTMDRLEGRIHCWGRAVLFPYRSVPTQNTQPPRLHQVQWEDWKWPLSLYGGKSLGFSPAP